MSPPEICAIWIFIIRATCEAAKIMYLYPTNNIKSGFKSIYVSANLIQTNPIVFATAEGV